MTVSASKTTTATPSTVGAPDPLGGDHVRLWPYAPGVFGRDALYKVWKLMEEDGATPYAFWDETGFATSGDLACFIRSFDGVAGKLVVMVEHLQTQQLCGAIFFVNMVQGHQAYVTMWMAKAYRGVLALEAAQLVLPPVFRMFAWQQLWAVTPWPNAGAMCRRVGFQRWCLLPGYCQWEGKAKDVWLYRLTRERVLR